MKRSFIGLTITICFFILITSTSCENNKKEILFACDSINVTYGAQVKVILENNCYNCHGTNTASSFGSGIKLDSYSSVKNWVNTNPGSNGGILLQNLKTGRMPKGAAMLNSCDIAKVSKWIADGALNN
jgi:mono/diheme cytochrome c family protein